MSKQSPVPVREEYRYEPLPAEPKGTACEVCGSEDLGLIWIHAEIEIRMPLFTLRTAAPLLCSRCNDELREHFRRVVRDLPPPFHGRKAEPQVEKSSAESIGAMVEGVLSKVSGRIE